MNFATQINKQKKITTNCNARIAPSNDGHKGDIKKHGKYGLTLYTIAKVYSLEKKIHWGYISAIKGLQELELVYRLQVFSVYHLMKVTQCL